MVIYLEEDLLVTNTKLVQELHSQEALEKILNKMQPLIKKYIRKLFFMEKEDASQELSLSLIEAVYYIKRYENEAMCFTYFQKAIINKFNYLCKVNIKSSLSNNEFEEIPDDIPYNENFDTIELFIDVQELLKDKNDRQKIIIKCIMFNDLSDSEIALKIGVSRQFVNRVKKKIFIDYFEKSIV